MICLDDVAALEINGQIDVIRLLSIGTVCMILACDSACTRVQTAGNVPCNVRAVRQKKFK